MIKLLLFTKSVTYLHPGTSLHYDAHIKFEAAQSISCCVIAFLLLIHYVTKWHSPLTLWPWPLTLNICSILAVMWSNSVLNVREIKQSLTELLQFQYLTSWPWTCLTCCTMLWVHVKSQPNYPFLTYSMVHQMSLGHTL